MNVKELTKAINEALAALEKVKAVINEETLTEEQLLEMSPPYLTSLPFIQFKQEVLKRYDYKKQRQALQNKDPEQADKLFPPLDNENRCLGYPIKNVIITNSCIEHVAKKHPNMTNDTWKEFLQAFDPSTDKKVKTRYNGRNGARWVYKCFGETNCFGYVLDILPNGTVYVVTVFCDHENSVDSWIQNNIISKSKDLS